MKKLFFIGFLSACVFWGGTQAYAKTSNSIGLDDPERLEPIVITLLMPEISTAVNDFYEPYLDTQPNVVAYLGDAKITNIEGEENRARYTITIEIEPYIGPHISVGKERITFNIGRFG